MRLYAALKLLIVVFHLTLALAFSASAAETIKNFVSQVDVAKDGTLTVTETITVIAEGRNIRRGIFRDFPLLFEDTDGKQKQVGFELLSVSRDGAPDGSRVERNRDRVRIYIGKSDVFLRSGQYTYEIKYRTDRQIRFFQSHDELFWNVTGNFWAFPIEKASVNFNLPTGVRVTDTAGFTGRFGEKGSAVRISAAQGRVWAVTTRPLQQNEGVSIAIKMPKGSINPPSSDQLSAWFWQDNLNMLLGIAALLVVAFYYLTNWWLVGRDPPSGVVVPQWKAPDGMSPGQVNYITNKGLAGKGFDAISSAVLNLAVKGLLTIDKHVDDIILKATGKQPDAALPVGEKSILNRVQMQDEQTLIISKDHGSKVKKLQEGFSSAMESEHRGKYYESNVLSVIIGVLLSLVVLVGSLYFGALTDELISVMFFTAILSVFFTIFLMNTIKRFSSSVGMGRKIMAMISTGFILIMMFSSFGSMFGSLLNAITIDYWPIVTLVGVLILNIVFFFLLGAPTALGRKKMDGIEGLKTYLTLAEKDRMNMADAPDFSVKHYEELLPYAVALGVEKPWSQALQTWLAAAVAAGTVAAATYRPDWYSGRSFDGDSLSDTMGDFTSSMQSGFASSMPVPKSSSSGFSSGGGFSGGGGGGGGGGGW